MDIGEPGRTYTIEPIEDPVPREVPVEPAHAPKDSPREPEAVPA